MNEYSHFNPITLDGFYVLNALPNK